MDETLRTWGKNIETTRNLRRPDGSVRTSSAQSGMSQTDLGELLDPPVTQATVSRWEAGVMEPRRHYKAQLAHALGVPAPALFPIEAVSA